MRLSSYPTTQILIILIVFIFIVGTICCSYQNTHLPQPVNAIYDPSRFLDHTKPILRLYASYELLTQKSSTDRVYQDAIKKKIDNVLVDLINDKDNFIREKAMEYLFIAKNTSENKYLPPTNSSSSPKNTADIHKILFQLKNPDPKIVEAAIFQLSPWQMGDKTIIPYLRPFLNSPNLRIQSAAEGTLIWLGDDQALLQRMNRIYKNHKTLRKVWDALEKSIQTKSEKFFEPLLYDPDSTIRYWAKTFHPLVIKYTYPETGQEITEELYQTKRIVMKSRMDMDINSILPISLIYANYTIEFQFSPDSKKDLRNFLQSDDPNFRVIAGIWLFMSGDTILQQNLIQSTTANISDSLKYTIKKLMEDIEIQTSSESHLLQGLNNPDISLRKIDAERLKQTTGKDYYWEKPNPRHQLHDQLRMSWEKMKSIYLTIVNNELKNLATTLESYYIDNGCYPPNLELTTKPIRFISYIPEDPFNPGHTYQYNLGANCCIYILTSIGPDGKDDIDEGLFNFLMASPYKYTEIQTRLNQPGDFTFKIGREIYLSSAHTESGDIVRTGPDMLFKE